MERDRPSFFSSLIDNLFFFKADSSRFRSEEDRLHARALNQEMYKEFEEDKKNEIIKTISKDMEGLDLETLQEFKQTIKNAKESNKVLEVGESALMAHRSIDNSIKSTDNRGRY